MIKRIKKRQLLKKIGDLERRKAEHVTAYYKLSNKEQNGSERGRLHIEIMQLLQKKICRLSSQYKLL